MFTLHYPIDDTIIVDGNELTLDLSFDVVMRFFDLMQDKDLNEPLKVEIALEMFCNCCFLYDMETKVAILKAIINEHVSGKQASQTQNSNAESDEQQKEYYSLTEDASYIYASFLQDYRLDLDALRGQLHWKKFNALLVGLREDTKFKKVVEIRMWKQSENDSKEHIAEMKKLQQAYALGKTQEDIEFESMDIKQKRAYEAEKARKGGG